MAKKTHIGNSPLLFGKSFTVENTVDKQRPSVTCRDRIIVEGCFHKSGLPIRFKSKLKAIAYMRTSGMI